MLPKGIIDHISDGYDKLWQMFIQPEKLDYSIESLGPRVSSFPIFPSLRSLTSSSGTSMTTSTFVTIQR